MAMNVDRIDRQARRIHWGWRIYCHASGAALSDPGTSRGARGCMKADRSIFTVLLLVTAAVFQLPAQQNEAGRKVLAEIRAGADKGDANAQYELGRAFFSGILGVAKDEAEAVKWYRKAAEQNVADAQFRLGVCYANGRGGTEDDAEGVKWVRRAGARNYPRAQYNLGVRYTKGQGVAKDDAEAVKWFRKAAEQNDARAQAALGVRYAKGQGVAKNKAEAVKWYRKAAEQNVADAQY